MYLNVIHNIIMYSKTHWLFSRWLFSSVWLIHTFSSCGYRTQDLRRTGQDYRPDQHRSVGKTPTDCAIRPFKSINTFKVGTYYIETSISLYNFLVRLLFRVDQIKEITKLFSFQTGFDGGQSQTFWFNFQIGRAIKLTTTLLNAANNILWTF